MKNIPVISIQGVETEIDTVLHKDMIKRHFSLSETVSLANLDRAKEFRDTITIKKYLDDEYEDYPICSTDLTTLGKYGIGLELYFLFIKQACLVFLLISFISVWPIIENYTGKGLGSTFQGQLYSYLTVANQESAEYETDATKADSIVSPLQKSLLNLSIADGLYTLIFLAFILQYKYTSNRVTNINQIDNVTAADYAIEIKGLPCKSIKPEKVKQHFSKYGTISEIYLSRIYNGRLTEYKKRADISYKLGLKKLINKKEKKTRRGTIRVLENAKLKFDENLNLEDTYADKTHDELPVGRCYIIFDRLEDRVKCLNDYKKINKCCWRKRKQKPRLMFKKKYPLLVKKAREPSDIIWENLEIPHQKRVIRRIFTFFITLIIILASISIVYTLKSYSETIPNTQNCKNLNIDGSLSVSEAALAYTDQTEQFCYCKQQKIYNLLASYRDFCQDYLSQESLVTFTNFMGSTGVVVINMILKMIISKLSQFERTTSETKQKLQTMTRVFIALFINTTILTLLANANFQNSVILGYIPYSDKILNGTYFDFTREWYTDVGSIITSTMIVNAITPHFINLLFWYPVGCIKRRCCWKYYKSQVSLNRMFSGPEFNIATKTSQVLTVIFSCYLYSGGMPFLNIICFITLFSLYWIDKTLILRHYKKPPFYSYDINRRLVSLLPLAGIFHCAFSLYMYGSSDIFPKGFYASSTSSYAIPKVNTLTDRIQTYSGVINLFLIFVGLGFITLNIFITPLKALCRRGKYKVSDEAAIDQGTYTVELEKIKAQGLHSYNIMENEIYRPLIISLNSAAEKVLKLRQKELGQAPNELKVDNLDVPNNSRNEENNILIK
jgi:hypothetical protein